MVQRGGKSAEKTNTKKTRKCELIYSKIMIYNGATAGYSSGVFGYIQYNLDEAIEELQLLSLLQSGRRSCV